MLARRLILAGWVVLLLVTLSVGWCLLYNISWADAELQRLAASVPGNHSPEWLREADRQGLMTCVVLACVASFNIAKTLYRNRPPA